MRVADLSWTQLASQLSGPLPPAVLLPLGALEAHGPHLPLDTDTVIAERLAEVTGEALARDHGIQALRAHPVPLSAASWAAEFPGTVSLAPEAARAVLHHALDALLRAGAKRIALVNLHFDPEHIAAVKDVVAAKAREGARALVFTDFTRRALAGRIGGEFASGACHGGEFETSLMLAADPGRVGAEYLHLAPIALDLAGAIRAGKRSFGEVGLDQAYCGNPAAASREEGERLFRLLADIIAGECSAAWK